MMDCARALELVDLVAAGETGFEDELRDHLAQCDDCAAAMAEAVAVAGLARVARTRVEPGARFDKAVLSRIENEIDAPRAETDRILRPAGRGWGRYVAAAAGAIAAAVVMAVVMGTPGGETDMGGARFLDDPAGEIIAQGEKIEVADERPVAMPGGLRALVSGGSSITVEEAGLTLDAGSCYFVNLDGETTAPALLTVPGMTVEPQDGAEAYLLAAAESEAKGPAAALLDWFSPTAWAAEADGPGAMLVVFSGAARVECGGKVMDVAAGQVLFLNGGPSGPHDIGAYLKQCQARLAGAEGADDASSDPAGGADGVAPGLAGRYEEIIASYDEHLAALRGSRDRLAADEAADPAAVAELKTRIKLIEEVRLAHARRIARKLQGTDKADAVELTAIRLRMKLIADATAGRAQAVDRLLSF